MNKKFMKKLVETLLCTVILLCMFPLVSHAATTTTHSHPLCGSSCACESDTHTSKSWTAWDGTTKMYNGYYYLTQDIVLESTMVLDYSYTSWLCLNGHSITCEDRVFDIYSYRSLLITDCKGTGKVETTGSDCTIGNNKYLSIWGGTILNSSENYGIAIEAYAGTTTYVCGGRVESTTGEAIYAYPGSKIKIEGGAVHGNYCAISGHDDTSGKLGSLTISGGRITAEQTYNVVELQNGSLTMTGGYVGGGVILYDEEGTVSVSGGTIDGELESAWSNEITITGGDMGISLGGNATIYAGTFRGTCYPGPNATITGGNFSACDVISTAKDTWICGGSYSQIRVAAGPLYLSGVPSIGSLQVDAPATVSAQSADGSGSFGGDTVEVILNASTDWSDGDIIIKDVTSDAVAAKFALTGVDPRWTYLERSGNDLVLRVLPHGTWGSSVSWGFVNGTLTVSGSGAIDYAHSGREYPWGDYVDEITEIIVEPGITIIPSYAFEYCESARSITLPETLETLALNAFNDCGSLNNLLLPASITSFGGTGYDTTFIRCESLTDVYYLGTAEEWGAVHNANYVTSANSQMTMHFLQRYEDPATCTTAGIEPYYLFDDTSVYGGMYNAAKQPITQTVVAPALGHRIAVEQTVQVDPLTVENTNAVPFVLTDGTYYSNNHSDSTTSQFQIVAQHACTLTLRYGVSSETNYDKLYILHNNEQKAMISGSVTDQVLTLELAAGDVVIVRYTKDGNVSSNQDQGWVALEYGMISGLESVDVPAETFEPDCTHAVVCQYCQTVVKEALGHRVVMEQTVQVDPLTVENNDAVPFALTDGTYYSNNHTDSSSSQLRIVAQYACTLTLRYGVSSEQNFDKLFILHNNAQKAVISGSVTGQTLTLELAAGDVVIVRYTKDNSVSKNQDRGWVTLEYGLVPGLGDVDVRIDTLEPHCTDAIICDYCQAVGKEAVGHQYENYVSNNDATCQSNATETGSCKYGCGETDTREIADSKAEHEFENYISNDDATCQSNATETGSCKYGCGETDTRDIADSKLAHQFENYVSNDDATCQSNATETAACERGCGETDTREIADSKVECEFENYISNNDATCQSNATEIGSCKYGCGEEHTREIADSKAEHEFENYISNDDATCRSNATETGSCKYGCGETDTREIADSKAECEFENYISNNDATCQSNATETGSCKYGCGEEHTRDIADSKLEHKSGEWIVDVEPTADTEGSQYKICVNDGCGEELEREAIPATRYVVASGTCGANVEWELDNEGVLTIFGTGAMGNYTYSNTAPWHSSHSLIKTVVIKPGVTTIGNAAFYRCSSLTSVTIPDSVTTIGGSAFYDCGGLTSLTIPSGVITFGDYVFTGCTGLKTAGPIGGNYNIQFGWTEAIPAKVFYGCRSLTSVTIPSNVTTIGNYAFFRCPGLTSVTISSGVTTIGGYAFYECTGLTSVTIPDSVTTIGGCAFWGCTGLTSVTIPSGVTTIVSYTFTGCSALTSVTIPDSVTTIGEYAFARCTSLTSVAIPDSMRCIELYAFANCTALTEVVYGGTEKQWSGVTLGSNAFPAEVAVTFADCSGHSFVDYQPADAATCQKNATETAECEFCYETDTREIANSKLEHTPGEWIVDLEPTETTEGSRYKVCINDGCGEELEREAIPATGAEQKNGLHQDEDGVWKYYVDGVMDAGFTGLVDFGGTLFYVSGGLLDWNYTGLAYFDAWYYINGGVVDWNYTGLADYYGNWFYVANGVLDWNYTGLVNYYGTQFYVANGVVDWNYVGLGCYDGLWYYVNGGVVDWTYTGLAQYYDNWFYMADGQLDWNFTGLVDYYGTQFYVANGVVDWDYVGLGCFDGTWYFVRGGVVDWTYTGLADYWGNWFYVKDGLLDWSYTGFADYYGTEFYVENGYVDWGFTGEVDGKQVVDGVVVG